MITKTIIWILIGLFFIIPQSFCNTKLNTIPNKVDIKKALEKAMASTAQSFIFTDSFNELITHHNTLTKNNATPTVLLHELTILANKLNKTIKQANALRNITKKTSALIPPVTYKNEKNILALELKTITQQITAKKNKNLPIPEDLINREKLLEEQINKLNGYIAADKKVAQEIAKNYIILSNSLKQRLHIYAAPQKYPNNFGKKPIKSISPKKGIYLLACDPTMIYKVKIRNQFGKLKRGKIVYNYHTLHRSGSKSDTFSSSDKGHQLIIKNYKNYTVHSMAYKGKGSLAEQKNLNIAAFTACACFIVLGSVLFFQGFGLIAAGAETAQVAGAAIAGGTAFTAGSIGLETLMKQPNTFSYKKEINKQQPHTPPPPYTPISIEN